MEHEYNLNQQIIIGEETKKELLDLYFTYEFSGHIKYVSRNNPVCATIWGFADSEKLSYEEIISVLLA